MFITMVLAIIVAVLVLRFLPIVLIGVAWLLAASVALLLLGLVMFGCFVGMGLAQ